MYMFVTRFPGKGFALLGFVSGLLQELLCSHFICAKLDTTGRLRLDHHFVVFKLLKGSR